MKYYLDVVARGQQLTVLSRSCVVAYVMPPEVARAVPQHADRDLRLDDGRIVSFRMFNKYEDSAPLQDLQPIRIEFYGDNPAAYFESFEGEFWVGNIDDRIVSYGGWRPVWGESDQAVVEHLAVAEGFQTSALEQYFVHILQQRARQKGFSLQK